MSNKHYSPFVILSAGILFGGVVGAAATLLAASKNGSETRANLMEKGTALTSQAISALKAGQTSSSGIIHRLRHQPGDLSNGASRPYHRAAFTIPEIQIE